VSGIFSLLLLAFSLAAFAPVFMAGSVLSMAMFGPPLMAGGALAVALYHRRTAGAFLAPSAGALIGAASGLFALLFFSIPMVAMFVYHVDDVRKGMSDRAAQLISSGYDPAKLKDFLDLLKTSQGMAFLLVFGLFMLGLIFVVGASIGGAWYSAWLRKRLHRP